MGTQNSTNLHINYAAAESLIQEAIKKLNALPPLPLDGTDDKNPLHESHKIIIDAYTTRLKDSVTCYQQLFDWIQEVKNRDHLH